jgi:hypothetical protein
MEAERTLSCTSSQSGHKRTSPAPGGRLGCAGPGPYALGMALHAALAAAATLLALAFMLSTLERWLARHKKHELMWTISLAMFALGSWALWAGATLGWGEWTYKAFYLFGAILNVPFLALGTVYLLCDERVADRWAAGVALLAAFASGIVVAAPIVGVIQPDVLPQGSAVFGPGPRIAAALGSGIASLVIIGGALWSAWRLLRTWRRSRGAGLPHEAQGPPPAISPARLAVANVIIAIGTLVLGSGGTLNSVADAMDAFAISLVLGIALIFGGFLLTAPRRLPAPALAAPEPWYPAARHEPAGEDGPPGTEVAGPATSRSAAERASVALTDTTPGSPHLN